MIDEDKLAFDASKAVRAQNLLDNELFAESHAKLEADLVAAWIASEPRDVEGREAAWRMIHANRKQKDFFQAVVNNGKLAAAELKALADNTERKRRFGVI